MSIFGPDGRLCDRDALRSLNFGTVTQARTKIDAAGRRVSEVLDSDTGRSAGAHIEHTSGRIDAVVTPPSTQTNTQVQE